ncbi:MAG TPA: RidA family protein [Pseudomonadota bacterium]|jgi:2-iminobutanoate/2-iminopropanoate deaminase|nr:RidA family protein [Pseudomonadota bacterium]
MNEGRTVVSTSAAPAAIGPYSQAIVAGNLVFCSGQIPLSPETGQIVGAGDIAAQTEQVMKNLSAVLTAAGCGFEQVVRCTIYLASMSDFATVNGIYGRFFPSNPPARTTIQAAGLPRGALVEIDAIAVRS